jgi:hypothetical protein
VVLRDKRVGAKYRNRKEYKQCQTMPAKKLTIKPDVKFFK